MDGIEPEPVEIAGQFETTGSNQSGMRQRNERLVLSILRRLGPLPKAEIARLTGLSAQTVSVIMRALEADGLLEKGEKVRGKVGQPSVPMRLAPEGALFFGLKVGRRSAELILVNFVGDEVAHVTETHSYPSPESTIAFVRTAVDKIKAKLTPAQIDRIAGMGVASPFFLWEWAATIGLQKHKMAAWKGFDLLGEIATMFDFPVYLGNDASCACGAELVFGTTEKPPEFLYIYLGYFVGGGVVLNGTLYTGRTGNAGAIGPFPILHAKSGQQLVDKASLIGLERRLTEATGDASVMVGQQEAWDIDPAILDDWLGEAIPALALMIIGAISIIDFPTVVIDGNMPSELRATVVKRVEQELHTMDLSGLIPPEICSGSIGSKARPLGAAGLALSKRFMLEM